MTELVYRSGPTVELVQAVGGDESILWAARVSTNVDRTKDFVTNDGFEEGLSDKDRGLVGYLMREKHGSPFEHNSMTFFVHVPIFVVREWQRHRIGFSYNEMSGRYTKLEPVFWMPDENRPLQNVGTSSRPEMGEGNYEQKKVTPAELRRAYETSWSSYSKLIDLGVANEVARTVLPVGIYTKMYVTMNLRSALAFLSLRTHEPEAAHVSRPQLEIDQAARLVEAVVAERFPVAHAAFNKNGRVAP